MQSEAARLETAFIGLGSNLDAPDQQVARALRELDAIPLTHCIKRSGLYRSPPMGPADQPDYVNAVAMIHTGLSPETLLDALLMIERLHGRVRGPEHWGPRTLDLDILLYGRHIVSSPRLTIPHAGLADRDFVLYPLKEVCDQLDIPGFGDLDELIALCPAKGLTRMESV